MINPQIDKQGNKRWRNSEGRLHREDGPAIEHPTGGKSWWINDKLHRENGPAIERADGTKERYIDGKFFSEEEFTTQTYQHKIIPTIFSQVTSPIFQQVLSSTRDEVLATTRAIRQLVIEEVGI